MQEIGGNMQEMAPPWSSVSVSPLYVNDAHRQRGCSVDVLLVMKKRTGGVGIVVGVCSYTLHVVVSVPVAMS